MSKIRLGIIGVGQIGKHHLATYQNIPDAEVVAACDIDLPELDRVCERFGIPSKYENFHDMLEHEELDAVDVCLHNNLHAPASIAVLNSGRHCYCEKPIAGSYIDGKAMVETARATGKRLQTQIATIFSKETKLAKRLIDAGHLGKLYHARSTGFRRRGRPYVDGYGTAFFVQKDVAAGGALFDMGVYHISQILYLLGMPKIERVSGKIYQETDMDPVRREKSGYSVEELGMGFVKCEGGLTIDIIESWAIHLGGLEGSSIVGSKGGVRLEPFSFHNTLSDVEMNATFEIDQADWRWHQLDPLQSAYDGPQQHWIAVLQGKVPQIPCADIALNTMLISEGIYLSDRLGREVTAEEIEQMSVSTAVDLG